MAIRRLPSTLVDRIAAGEVVERPASVVKELVENSLDAGARQVRVALAASGVTRILVEDDGTGMAPAQATLALERHATSKLPGDDLEAIASFGFRGEALPSIASVARLTLETRAAGAPGWRITVDSGEIVDEGEAGVPRGTAVRVEGLFARVPARLKFLKSPRTELAAAIDTVRRLALARPDVGFLLEHEGRVVLDCPPEAAGGVAGLLARARCLVPEADTALPVDAERGPLLLGGLATPPTGHRASSAGQYLFVNGRPVRDRALTGALAGAYRGRLPAGRWPVAVLHLACPPALVDVNVHPAKTEVRFADPAAVRALIVAGVRRALDMGTAAPAARAAEWPGAPAPPPSPAPGLLLGAGAMAPGVAERAAAFAAPAGRAAAGAPLGRAVAQLALTYVVAQAGDELVLVDQHAAHERLVLEALRRARAGRAPPMQHLLAPRIVAVDPGREALFDEAAPLLAALGLNCAAFGAGAVAVRGVPAMLAGADVEALVRDLADALAEGGAAQAAESLEAAAERVAATIACHGSVRAGRRLGLDEMDALLRQIEAEPAALTCNHGRPTTVRLGRDTLERLFGRR